MDLRIQDAINDGYIHSAIGLSRDTDYKDFSRDDFIKLINFCYERFLHFESFPEEDE